MRSIVVASIFVAGCVEPEVGSPSREACTGEDSDPDTEIDYARDIDGAIIHGGANCQLCHTPGFGTPIGLSLGGLDLSSAEALRRGGIESGTDIVVPGDPCNSILVQKIGASPPFGARMPLDGPPYLDRAQVQVIIDWIAEGAHAE